MPEIFGQGTLRDSPASTRDRPVPAEPHLFVVLECRRPLAGGARASLRDVDEVTLGRGEERATQSLEPRRLDLRVPDAAVSQRHARLFRDASGWVFEDLGSTNGSRVGGVRVTRAPVPDGTVIEVGATLLVLRTSLPTPPGTPSYSDSRGATRPLVRDATRPLAPMTAAPPATLLPEYVEAVGVFARIAMSQVPMLLLGESGTGKEVLARAAHAISGRRGAFVAVNCGALPASLVEAQFFGHARGAFSGAVSDQPGFVRASDGGTLFLDEIGDLPRGVQAVLLRVLQEREVTPVGSSRAYGVDLRVLAATHRRVDAPADTGAEGEGLRRDLYARLAGFTHFVPPLRDCKEDVGVLVAELLPVVAPGRAERLRLSIDVGRALLAHDWPLNVRELSQALSVAAVLANEVIELSHAPEPLRHAVRPRTSAAPLSPSASLHPSSPSPPTAPPSLPPEEPRELGPGDAELRDALVTGLRSSRGNVSEVARAMGKTRMQIHRWMRRFAIDPESYRS